MKTIIKDEVKIPDFENIPNDKFLQEKIVKRECPEFHQLIYERYPEIDNWYEKLYLFKHNLDSPPICPICKINRLKYIGPNYNKYCSCKCSANSPIVRDNYKKTCEERFGCENPQQNEIIRNKTKETFEEKFGGPAPASSPVVRNKMKETCEKRFGCPSASNLSNIRTKIANTLRQNHIDEDENLLGYEGKLQIRDCPHKDSYPFMEPCKTCPGYYTVPYNIYIARKDLCEPCTKLLPVKTRTKTSIELATENILIGLGVNYIYNCNNLIKLGGQKYKQLDFYLPDYKIALEINGCMYHSIEGKSYKKDQHIFKHNECKKRGIKLYYIWEDWFKNLKNIEEYIRCIISGENLEKFKPLWFPDLNEHQWPNDLGWKDAVSDKVFEHHCFHGKFECYDSGYVIIG